MPQLLCHAVSVAGGAGHGIALTAGCKDDRIRLQFASVAQLHGRNRPHRGQHHFDTRIQHHAHAVFLQHPCQRPGYVACFFRRRKHAPAALHHNRTSGLFQQRHHILGRKHAQRAVQEPRIARHLPQEFLLIAIVGHVAATLAGDVDLFAQLFIAFQQCDVCAALCGVNRREHAARAATDDDNLSHACSLPPDRRSARPRYSPAASGDGSARPCDAGPAIPAAR